LQLEISLIRYSSIAFFYSINAEGFVPSGAILAISLSSLVINSSLYYEFLNSEDSTLVGVSFSSLIVLLGL
jgi:hypothetical protein